MRNLLEDEYVLYQRRFEKQPITIVEPHSGHGKLYQRRFEKQPITPRPIGRLILRLYQRRFEKQPITDHLSLSSLI